MNRDAVPACRSGVNAPRPRLGPAPTLTVERNGPQRGAVRGKRPVPMRRNPCRVRGSPDRGSFDAPGKHSLRSASLGCMPQARWACSVTARRPTLPPFVIFVPFVVPDSTGTAGSLPPPPAETTAPAQRRPTCSLRCLRAIRGSKVCPPQKKRTTVSALPSPCGCPSASICDSPSVPLRFPSLRCSFCEICEICGPSGLGGLPGRGG